MIVAQEIYLVGPGLFIWHAYDPKVKAELFSTALVSDRGTLLVDPIPVVQAALAELLDQAPLLGIVVTNNNHWRVSTTLAGKFSAPVFAHPDLVSEAGTLPFQPAAHGTMILNMAEVIVIEGAAPAEIALHVPAHHGSLIVGDALINFDPYGFTCLPAKYCSNPKQMRRSLRQLLKHPSERMLFAHGIPILSKAGVRLEQLLENNA
jgi:Metallo-beta-lactamase superfamily